MTRVLFLDIDGVLTSARAHAVSKQRDAIWHNFDPIAVGFLNRLAEDFPDLRFVLSSMWRKMWDQQTMTMFLSQAGWAGTWHQNWKTPTLNGPRGLEIEAWLNEHKPDGYVILDDRQDMLEHQKSHLVLTPERNGMNSIDHYLDAKEILKKRRV